MLEVAEKKDITEQINVIKEMIQERIDNKELTPCQFFVSKTIDEQYVEEVKELFDKYGVVYGTVDSFAGAFDLNRDWIQTDIKSPISCAVEFCGVYPADWDIEDVVKLVNLEFEGKVIIMVYYIDGENLIPNN